MTTPALPAPYYTDDHVALYHADHRQHRESIAHHDVLLTDPPYGINVARKGVVGRLTPSSFVFKPSDWDKAPPTPDDTKALFALATWHFVFGGNHIGYLPRATSWLVWHKTTVQRDFADAELIYTNLPTVVRVLFWKWAGFMQQAGAPKEPRVHPTQKPMGVIHWLLAFVPAARTVLDPYCGSGTTGVVAKQRGLRATLFEREEQYCEAAAKRLAATAPGCLPDLPHFHHQVRLPKKLRDWTPE